METLTEKIEALLDAVNRLVEKVDQPPPDLCELLRSVAEITRRGASNRA